MARLRFHYGLWQMPSTARSMLELGEQPLAWETLLNTSVTDNRIGKDPKGKAITGFSWDPVAGGVQTDVVVASFDQVLAAQPAI